MRVSYPAAQADRLSVGTICIARRGIVLDNAVGSVNLFRFAHYESISWITFGGAGQSA